MNLTLSPHELLHVMEVLIKNPMQFPEAQSALMLKVNKPLLAVLEKHEANNQESLYRTWSHEEQKKIEELQNKNSTILIDAKRSTVEANK